MYLYSFEKLEVWQLSRKLVGIIYKITDKFPVEERFGLTNQLRRACVSKGEIDERNTLVKELSNKLNALSKSYANKQPNNQINK